MEKRTDFEGIGLAIEAAARMYFQTSRATGRTTAMVQCLKEGDRVFFESADQARQVEYLAKKMGIEGVDFRVAQPRDPHPGYGRPPAIGKVIFDHVWLERYYLNVLIDAQERIWELEQLLSRAGLERKRESEQRRRHNDKFGPWFFDTNPNIRAISKEEARKMYGQDWETVPIPPKNEKDAET